MKNDLNVFTYGMYSWKHPTNWFNNIKMFFKNLGRAKDRATKGFCDWDIWDTDVWLIELIPKALKEFKDKTEGYPDSVGSYENWLKILDEMIQYFETANELIKDEDKDNPYAEEYNDMLANRTKIVTKSEFTTFTTYEYKLTDEQEELRKKYVDAYLEIQNKIDDNLKKGFELISKYIRHLWW